MHKACLVEASHLLFHSACQAPLWKRHPMQNCTGVTSIHLAISSSGKPATCSAKRGRMMGIMGKTMPKRNTGSVRQALAKKSCLNSFNSALWPVDEGLCR